MPTTDRTTPLNVAEAELARAIDAAAFGLTVADVAEQWADYSRDVYAIHWAGITPETVARFVGWLIRAMRDASN